MLRWPPGGLVIVLKGLLEVGLTFLAGGGLLIVLGGWRYAAVATAVLSTLAICFAATTVVLAMVGARRRGVAVPKGTSTVLLILGVAGVSTYALSPVPLARVASMGVICALVVHVGGRWLTR